MDRRTGGTGGQVILYYRKYVILYYIIVCSLLCESLHTVPTDRVRHTGGQVDRWDK